MNTLDLILNNTSFTLGWTLLHTLWQGALVLIMLYLIQSFIPVSKSYARYLVGCSALMILLLISTGTFISLSPSAKTITNTDIPTEYTLLPINPEPASNISVHTFLNSTINFISQNMNWFITIWAVGVMLFSLRFLGGLIYLRFLTQRVIEVSDHWKNRMKSLAIQAGVYRTVQLVESIHIHKPIVIGFVKPMILLPVGLLTGMPTIQIEAILLHELSHIRRHDFLINIIQTLIEIILFFNPFVWIISGFIRKEREHCCDDYVISRGSNPLQYVKALAMLEEISISTPALAMALGKNKFQVFNRVKRIMEKSVNQQNNRVRPLAVVVLVLTGLICTSWLMPETKNEEIRKDELSEIASASIFTLSSDTTAKEQKVKSKKGDSGEETKSARYSRKIVTTYDEEGNPHEEIVESYEGDEELRPLFSAPTVPSVPALPSIPLVPSFPSMPSIPSFSFRGFPGDSIPGFYNFSPEDEARWEAFGEEMEARFENFGRDHEEFGRMMEAWADDFDSNFGFRFDGFEGDLEKSMELLEDRLRHLQDSEHVRDLLDHGLKDMEENLKRLDERMKEHQGDWSKLESRMRDFENEMSEQLIKDGYLKKGERIESMNWGDNSLTVNGIKIKEKDIAKYEEISKKHFNESRGGYLRN